MMANFIGGNREIKVGICFEGNKDELDLDLLNLSSTSSI